MHVLLLNLNYLMPVSVSIIIVIYTVKALFDYIGHLIMALTELIPGQIDLTFIVIIYRMDNTTN